MATKESLTSMRENLRRKIQREMGDGLSRNERRLLAKRKEKEFREHVRLTAKLCRASYESGAGFVADEQLRVFFVEYNSRLQKGQILPANANALKDFFFFDKKLQTFILKPERDHLFSFSDFIDFATSSDCHSDPMQYMDLLEDGVIYSFNNYEPVDEMTISTDSDHEFGISAVSIIKNGTSLNVLITGGLVREIEALLEEDRVPPTDIEVHPLKKNVSPHPDYKHEPVALDGSESKFLHRTLAFVRFNTVNKTRVCRYVLRDWGDRFSLLTDDPSPMMLLPETEREKLYKLALDELPPYSCLLELCSTFLALPHYFRFKIDLVRDEDSIKPRKLPQDFKKNISKVQVLPEAIKDNLVRIHRVSALRITNPVNLRAIRRYSPPLYQVEVSGFWRNLQPGSLGLDANGHKIEGKTWVKGHLRWLSLPERPKKVLLKSKVSLARVIAASEQLCKSVSNESLSETTDSIVSTNHSLDVFTEVSRKETYLERRKLTTKLRFRIFDRDNYRCMMCGADAATDSSVRLDVDHVVPISKGGKTIPENLRTLCSRCNNGKGAALV